MSELDLLGPLLLAMVVTSAGLVLAALLGLWRPEGSRRVARWLTPAAAFLLGAWLVRGIPPLPPREAGGWIWWAVAATALTGFAAPPRLWLIWTGRVGAILLLLFLLLRPLLGRAWEGLDALLHVALFGLLWLAVWWMMDRAQKATTAWHPLLVLLLATVGLSILLMVSGTATYAQYALALGGMVAGAGVWSLPGLRRWVPDSRPATALLAVPWSGLLISGYVFAEMQPWSALLAAVALLALVFPVLPHLKRLRTRSMVTIQVGWTILVFIAAIAWAYHHAPRFD
jgi:hypothetical protein